MHEDAILEMEAGRCLAPLHDGNTLLKRFFRYVVFGAVGVFVHYCILIALVNLLQMRHVLSSAMGFSIGALCNYAMNYHFTFDCGASGKSHGVTVVKFYALALVGLGLNSVIMSIAMDSLGYHYLLAQVIATGLVLAWNFIGNLFWTFR